MTELFLKGGPLMWPILAASLLALTLAMERLLFLSTESLRRTPETLREMLAHLQRGDIPAARTLGAKSRDFVARALARGLEHPERFSTAMPAAASHELRRFSRGLSVLDTIVTLAPLLGLLGTVTGMIRSFGMLGGAELGAPAAITGGIAEALLATAFGLGVAITALLPLNFMNAHEEKARLALQDAATQAELFLKP